MEDKGLRDFDFMLDPQEPVFAIGIVSEMVRIPIWTLRKLDEMDVVKPKRFGRKTRCYSQHQLQVLQYVHYLMEEKNVNISGIKVILEIEH